MRNIMSKETLIPVPQQWAKQAFIDRHRYQHMYEESVVAPDTFWAAQAEQFTWRASWDTVEPRPFRSPVSIKWFEDAKLNITENCLDRHLPARASQTAYIWEGDDPADSTRITYGQLHETVCRLANVLKSNGVKKGDRITIYLPMIP